MGHRNEPEQQAEQAQSAPEQVDALPRAGPAVTTGPLDAARVQALQRTAGNAAVTALLRAPAAGSDAADVDAAAAGAAGSPSLIAEDDAPQLQPGQLRRSEFLERARQQVTAVVSEAAEGMLMEFAAMAIAERWLADAAGLAASDLDRSIRRSVPAAAAATTAQDYLPLITAKVRRELASWQTAQHEQEGQQAEEQQGAPALLPKLEPGAPKPDRHDPAVVAARLGGGTPLAPDVGARMGGALGRELSEVRVHADGAGGKVAGELGARAVTVGDHIAFAPGEYRPGTPVGDALLAHELAHVAQQSDAGAAGLQRKGAEGDALERDADLVAAEAVTGLWGRAGTLARSALPRLRTGVRLQNCNGGGGTPAPVASAPPVAAPPVPSVRGPDQHAGAHAPDAAQQAAILSELNPGAFAPVPVAPVGPMGPVAPPPARIPWDGQSTEAGHVAARARLKRDLTAALVAHLAGVMPGIRAEATRPRINITNFEGPGRAAKADVDAVFGHLKAAAALSAAGRHGVSFTASGPGRNLFDANDPADRAASGAPISANSVAFWMALHDPAASTIVQRHHFEPDNPGTESETFMMNDILTPFVSAPGRRADLELYDLWGFALAPGGAGVGRTVATPTTLNAGLSTTPGAPGQPSPAERGTRWSAWQLLVHEYIHTLAHPQWDDASSAGGSVMNEGFCEMFTAEILTAQIATAGNDASRRATVEGNASTPPPGPSILPTTYTSPVTYQADRQHAENIRATAGANAVRAAYFQGHVEFLGLDPGGRPAAPAAAADMCTLPRGVTTLPGLATASGLTEAEIRTANPGVNLAAGMPARLALPGARDHRIVAAFDRAARANVIETRAQIATQNGVSEADLVRANPGIPDWTRLAEGDRVLVPKI